MNLTGWIGLGLMIVSQGATLASIEPFWSWNTPVAWTGFILFADAIVWRARGNSWIRSNPGEFAVLALLSIPLWVVFEGYNLRIRNWYYSGLPDNTALRLFGYGWSFATISPAIFEAAELIAVLRAGNPGGRGGSPSGSPGEPRRQARANRWASPHAVWDGGSVVSLGAGAVMLASPWLVASAAAQYLAAPVWLGFIFVLDPINARLGAQSLRQDTRAGRYDRLINLLLAGLLCGVLWEFWNYWAGTKWHYTVPIFERTKVFEMPLPGYLGFPPFAIECFTMYVFVRAVYRRLTGASPAHELDREIAL